MPTRVFLCRHAETESWAQGRLCGALDVGLSPAGVEQARALGAALADSEPSALYASPLRRARETAALVAEACGLGIVEAPGLAEIDFGELARGPAPGAARGRVARAGRGDDGVPVVLSLNVRSTDR